MSPFWDHFNALLTAGTPFVCVTLVDAVGSTPQDRGSRMIVTSDGLAHGTVGGGKVEAKAIELARGMLTEPAIEDRTRFVEWNLQRDVGMTCGGLVRLFFEVYHAATWNIAIFGAGHIAQALARTLLNLDCCITCFDTRPEWIDRLPAEPKLTARLVPDLPAQVAGLPRDAYICLITMGHASDAPVLAEILKRDVDFPYVGVIGSKAKRRALTRSLAELGVDAPRNTQYHCPMGLPIGSNHPYEIAISIAAQLLQVRDARRTTERNAT